jgi:exodeoxyribonuclease-3
MKLISWNVNGIRACSKKGFADFLKKERPDVLGLQETKIAQKDIDKTEFDFADYEEFWNPAERPGYSGTAILIRRDVPWHVSTIDNGIGIEEFDKEGRVQTMEFKDFYFINAYFPNANGELSRLGYKLKFNDAFLKYAKNLEKKKPVIICGDLNVAHQPIDLTNPRSNEGSAGYTAEERRGMDKFLAAGFVDTFRHFHPQKVQYSWWSYRFGAREKNIGWRIDYFLASVKIIKKVSRSFIMDRIMGSDHCPVGIEIVF